MHYVKVPSGQRDRARNWCIANAKGWIDFDIMEESRDRGTMLSDWVVISFDEKKDALAFTLAHGGKT